MKTQLYLFIYPSQSTAHPAVAFQTLWVVYCLPTSAFSFSSVCILFEGLRHSKRAEQESNIFLDPCFQMFGH